jgi:hypothetical protein
MLRSDLNWVDQVNYRAQKVWKVLHFVMRVLKKGNKNTKRLAYTSFVRHILEYGSTCWDPCKEGDKNALDRAKKRAEKFNYHTKGSDWETLLSVGR